MGAVKVFLAVERWLIGDTNFFRYSENDLTGVR